jgi:type I restriction enzyme R subunit
MSHFSESSLERWAVESFQSLGYTYLENEKTERIPNEVILQDRFKNALIRINPKAHPEAIEEACHRFFAISSQNIVIDNQKIHSFLADGMDVEYFEDGRSVGDHIRLIDYDNIENSDFLVVNQLTVMENGHTRRPDLVVFVNGLPLAVIELKKPTNENVTIEDAYNQLQTYKEQIPNLFRYNEALVISDGINAAVGSLTAKFDRFMPWRTEDG